MNGRLRRLPIGAISALLAMAGCGAGAPRDLKDSSLLIVAVDDRTGRCRTSLDCDLDAALPVSTMENVWAAKSSNS